ncbi:MAG: SpoIID/LytB domain-containing protein [Ruminococcaceae bacterium]|nr:SpoIID/LytB domain-containing protein [Oscillospiraceae bacterium]
MPMKKRYFTYIIIAALLLFSLSFGVAAGERFYVNDAGSPLPEFFNGVYAIGSDGVALLSADKVYAMSAAGLQELGAANCVGGGGLVSEDGTVSIRSNRVTVGLYYYYSESRDSSLASATLENLVGSGFAFGYYDDDGVFAELARTETGRITVRPEGSGVCVFSEYTGEVLYSQEYTDKDNYMIVSPLGEPGEVLTAFSGCRYRGDFGFAVRGSAKLTVTNTVDIEPYVMGVCACEMSESWPVEALKAQAVAARTYVQKMIGKSVYYYSCGFDVTADTYCQVYRGCGAVGSNIEAAVAGTENRYLTYRGDLVDALYSAADGGATESNRNVFGNNVHPYLNGVVDPYEAAADAQNPYSSWRVVLTPAQLGDKVGIGPVRELTPTYSETGNVIRLDFVSGNGQTATLIRDNCRTTMGLKSIRYEVSVDDSGNYVFEGSGFGHNLGMSQWGAYAMAKYYARDFRDILGFYYTGVALSWGEIDN